MVGHGASGYTWRARNVESGQQVAIKELSFRRLTDLKQLDLFEREASALEDLSHRGVPTFFDQFVVQEQRFVSAYLVQEFIDGGVICLDRRTCEDEVRQFLLDMAHILDYLHGRRPPVIHRDIKPSNVMRRANGEVVLIDFGSIRAASQATVGGSTVAGTLGYMAPEQLLGHAEPASDFYGLGATAVAMLAGQDASRIIDSHSPGQWRESVQVSQPLGDLLERLLAPRVDDRLDTAQALLGVLENLDHQPSSAPPPAPKRVSPAPAPKRVSSTPAAAPEKPQPHRKSASVPPSTYLLCAAAFIASAAVTIALLQATQHAMLFGHLIAALKASSTGLWVSGAIAISTVSFMAIIVASRLFESRPVVRGLGAHRFGLYASLSGVVSSLIFVYIFTGLSAPTDEIWYVDYEGNARQIAIGKRGKYCHIFYSDAESERVLAVNTVQVQNFVCEVRVGSTGVWLERQRSSRTHHVLFDLWTGERIYDTSEDLRGDYRVVDIVDGQLQARLPNSVLKTVGPTDQREGITYRPRTGQRSSHR